MKKNIIYNFIYFFLEYNSFLGNSLENGLFSSAGNCGRCAKSKIQAIERGQKEYKGSDSHTFVQVCEESGITQGFTRVERPQTNGKAERFIHTLMEMWHQKKEFTSRKERRISLKTFVNWYNTVKPDKGIENMTSYEVIENFYYPEKV